MTTVGPMPEVLFEDDYFIILNKPANLLSVPGRGADKQDCLSARVQARYPQAEIVHRLDYDTSGIMLMAKDKPSQREASILFQQRAIEKTYIAIISGHPSAASGSIDLPMRCDYDRRPLQIIDHELGKPALTFWTVLEQRTDNTSRVELKPHTGRSHQLRLHMASIGHPILGDNLYRNETSFEQSNRLLLHASQLYFDHPFTSESLTTHSPAPF